MWIVFTILSIACLIVAITRTAAPNKPPDTPIANPKTEGVIALPRQQSELEVWNEFAITKHLDDLRGQPLPVVTHYIDSVKSRWVINQNDKTALARAKFLTSKLQELKLLKEGQQIMVDLEVLALEREKRLKNLQLENAQLDDSIRNRGQRDQLLALKERKQIELEIAKLDKEMTELTNPTKPEPQLTPERRRADEKAACEARIQSLKEEKQSALKIEDRAERVMRVNALDDAIQREYERWGKLV